MFNLLGQSKAQIMIINVHEMRLFNWQNKNLSYQSSFSSSTEGLAQLSQKIIKDSHFPVIIITNFMEESFLNETAAHVTGNDRKALLERKLAYAFRTTPYRIAKITEREEEGRRDDKVLLSALTKPDLLKPWIDCLLSNQIAIQSITSMAYLTEAFTQSTGAAKEEHLLIISLDNGSELRQTYLKKGKILFSRLTILSSDDATVIGNNIYKESLQIRSYLERIKSIPYNAELKIQVFSPYDDEEISIQERTTDLNIFEVNNTHTLANTLNLTIDNPESNSLRVFIAQALQKKRITNTYAPAQVRRYFHLNTIARTLTWSSLLIIASLCLLQIPTLSSALKNRDQQQQINLDTIPYTTEYDILSQRFPETPIPSTEMALVVESFEKIQQQSVLPSQALSIISRALRQSPNLKITTIDWELIEKAEITNDQGGFGFGSLPSSNSSASFQQATLDQRLMIKVQVNGLVFSPRSYREAQNQVNRFSQALNQEPNVSVTPLQMPTEVRIDTEVQTTVDGDEIRSQFILELDIEINQ